MKTIVVFGGSGGLGVKLIPLLKNKYNVISLGSKDVDITKFNEVQKFFNNNDVDIVLIMSGKKYDVFLSDQRYGFSPGELGRKMPFRLTVWADLGLGRQGSAGHRGGCRCECGNPLPGPPRFCP